MSFTPSTKCRRRWCMFRCTKKGAVRWDAFQRRKRIYMVKFSNRVEQGATKIWEPPVIALPHSGRVCQSFLNDSICIHAASVMSVIAKITLYASLVYLDGFVTNSTGDFVGPGSWWISPPKRRREKSVFVVMTFLYKPKMAARLRFGLVLR